MKTKNPRNWTRRQQEAWQLTVGQRLAHLIEDTLGKRKQWRFAKIIGLSQGSLSDIIRGKSSPSALTLLKIDANTNINILELLRG